jgi:RNA polymerase sigma-70 factor (ECF subfamily)
LVYEQLHRAAQAPCAVDASKSKVVELKFFGGLSVKEIAEVWKVSTETEVQDCRISKSWLLREMSGETRLGA